jgi:Xaa-Pro aminopeptidase
MMNHTLLPSAEFSARREILLTKMPANSIALFSAAQELTRSNDTEFPFCQNKTFYYLTGFNEPDAVLLLCKGVADGDDQQILFCRAKDPLQEIWHGRRVGPKQAQDKYGFDLSFSLDKIDQLVPQYLNCKSQLLSCHGADNNFEQQLLNWNASLRASARQGTKAVKILVDCSELINEMRLIKSPGELAIMRQVNHISGLAHQRAMKNCQAGKFEYQIEADILHEFAHHGARYPAYSSIVAGGDNGNILHYTDNSAPLIEHELLLIDAGGELAGYAADITRTFPINGRFSAPQKAIYQLVLDSQELAISQVAPGQTLAQLNVITGEFLTRGLHQLGILTGDVNELVQDNACKKYFIHGLGHWLGLDVHDVGDYQVEPGKGQQRKFEPGMVMTIEPGLYIALDDESVAKKWRGIAVRIEDNVLVSIDGYENLTVNAPKLVTEIESLMAQQTEQ